MPRRTQPQLVLAFARPGRRKGGLELGDYQSLVERLRQDAARVGEQFHLPPFELDADRPDSVERYGICFDDGRIRVRLVHATTGRALKYSAMIDTVVHELAHLQYMDHGPRWEALYHRMLAWCRKEGLYRPRPIARRSTQPGGPKPQALASSAGPRQLGLFTRDNRRTRG